jgi:hypothetical protein
LRKVLDAMIWAQQSLHQIRLAFVCLLLMVALSFGVSAQSREDESKSGAPETGTVRGRVIDESGQPVRHATVYVNASVALPQRHITFTDDGGNFQINGLDALIYNVGASAPSYVTTPREPDSLPSYYRIGDSVTISMLKGGVITGTVTSVTGEPMVQMGVRAILIRDANGQPPAALRFPPARPTDDRGIYRIYGLTPGTYLVSAGGGGGPYGYSTSAHGTEAPTYAPSATRDGAAEIIVRAGEETTGVDIRYRDEPGYAVSGVVNGPTAPNSSRSINISLTQIINGGPQSSFFSYQLPASKGFAFYGIADGDYDLVAQSFLNQGEIVASEPRRITVKGRDVTGIELVLKGLASISGRLTLEASTAAECKNKRHPLLSETLLSARRSEKNPSKDRAFSNLFAQGSPDKSGNFLLRNLAPGQFNLDVRFFAKYWYVRSIAREPTAAQPVTGRVGVNNRQTDAARSGISLKFGERVSGLTVTLAEGAASLRGAVKTADGESVPPKLYLYLAPAEKENVEDVLRFFITPIPAEGTFGINNLPPGRYWAVIRVAADNEPQSISKLRAPEETAMRTQIRRAAETAKTAVEFKPCENVSSFELPFKNSLLKK